MRPPPTKRNSQLPRYCRSTRHETYRKPQPAAQEQGECRVPLSHQMKVWVSSNSFMTLPPKSHREFETNAMPSAAVCDPWIDLQTSHGCRIDHHDTRSEPRQANKVPDIERQHMCNGMNVTNGDKAGIMDLFANHT